MLPDVRPLRSGQPGYTAFMRLRAHEAEEAGQPVRHSQRWVNYDRISASLKRAVLVTEDASFWDHEGIDLGEIRASLAVNWTAGRFVRGGSTITQQLAKNLYLSPTRNPYRKLAELFITRRLEAELTKGRILELYLNVIEWGDGVWGAEAASVVHFRASAGSLSAEQAALLAASIINPRVYNPSRPNSRLVKRQYMILSRMGAVTPPTTTQPPPPPQPQAFPSLMGIPIQQGVPPGIIKEPGLIK
jgi:monofunctional biosynthetic peptidoglycan transglycosylase